MSWWKHFVRGAENLFRGQVGKGPIGASNTSPTDTAATTDPNATPLGGAATSNAGDAVVNYQTKGKPGVQQTGKSPVGS